jgi:hypothetical protein
MPIGTGTGQTYETEYDYQQAKFPKSIPEETEEASILKGDQLEFSSRDKSPVETYEEMVSTGGVLTKKAIKAAAPNLTSLIQGKPPVPIIRPEDVPVGSKIPSVEDTRVLGAAGEIANVVSEFIGGPGGGAKGLSTAVFGGIGAMTAQKGLLKEAFKMLRKGKDPDEVFRRTGWWRAPDGKMRFEISDEGLKYSKLPEEGAYIHPDTGKPAFNDPNFAPNYLKDGGYVWEGKLSDVIEHDKLFEAYPQLRNLRVQFGASSNEIRPGTINAVYYPPVGKYGQAMIVIQDNPIGGKLNKRHIESLLHEVQHAIQDIEGFVTGANFGSSLEMTLMNLARVQKGAKPGSDLDKKISAAVSLLRDVEKNPEWIKSLNLKVYQGQLGEVEARNVSRRWMDSPEFKPPGMGDARATDYVPRETEDVPRNLQANFTGEPSIPIEAAQMRKLREIETDPDIATKKIGETLKAMDRAEIAEDELAKYLATKLAGETEKEVFTLAMKARYGNKKIEPNELLEILMKGNKYRK